MADNNFTIGDTISLDTDVSYGVTTSIPGTAYAHTFSPVQGVTALNIDSISVSASNAIPGLTATAGSTLPYELTWDGTTSTILDFTVSADNSALHTTDYYTDIILSISGTGTSLSSGVTGTMINGTWTANYEISALGANITPDVTPQLSAADTTVAYGASSTLIGTTTFSSSSIAGNNTGLSSVSLDIYLSGDTAYFSAVSATIALPATDVAEGTVIGFSTIYNNNYLHSSTELETINVVVSTSNTQIDTGWADSFTQTTTGYVGGTYTLSALGDAGAPSGVSGFTATPWSDAIRLTWTNPTDSDLSAVNVQFSTAVSAIPSAYNLGTHLYNGISTATTHSPLTSYVPRYYSIFTQDNVGNWSTGIVSATATPYDNQYAHPLPWESSADTRRRLYIEGIV